LNKKYILTSKFSAIYSDNIIIINFIVEGGYQLKSFLKILTDDFISFQFEMDNDSFETEFKFDGDTVEESFRIDLTDSDLKIVRISAHTIYIRLKNSNETRKMIIRLENTKRDNKYSEYLLRIETLKLKCGSLPKLTFKKNPYNIGYAYQLILKDINENFDVFREIFFDTFEIKREYKSLFTFITTVMDEFHDYLRKVDVIFCDEIIDGEDLYYSTNLIKTELRGRVLKQLEKSNIIYIREKNDKKLK
jgi:hypothetical protein